MRLAAKSAGLAFYEGRACVKCGGHTRFVNGRHCVACRQATQAAYAREYHKARKCSTYHKFLPKLMPTDNDCPRLTKEQNEDFLMALQREKDGWNKGRLEIIQKEADDD